MASKPVASERSPDSTGRAAILAAVFSMAALAAFLMRPTVGAFGDLVTVVGIICAAAAVASFSGWLASQAARTASRFVRALETIRSYLADEPASFESSDNSPRH